MSYNPVPKDLSKIELPPELVELAEKLAENVHDNWAFARMKEGWTYGKNRNDLKKLHPCLVSYAMLPESEKNYDRLTATETLKYILSCGFKIIP